MAGSSSAAKGQKYAARLQDNYARNLYSATNAQGRPYREAGYTALAAMMDMSGLNRGYFGTGGGSTMAPDGTTDYSRATGAPSGEVSTERWGSMIDPQLGKGSTILANRPQYNFEADPGYQFRLDQGKRQIENSAAARGGLLSGGALKGLTEYNQGFASNEYMNVYNRLASIAGIGTAPNQAIGASSALIGAAGSNYAGAGMSRGSGYIGAGNAFSTGAGQYAQYTGWMEGGRNNWGGWGGGGPNTGNSPQVIGLDGTYRA
jgi:hypothetical protein